MVEGGKDKGRNSDSRERIFNTAVTLFAKQGFDRTGMRELARVAGVNLSMINYFYGSKKKLLVEILDFFFSQYIEIARTSLLAEGDVLLRIETFIINATFFFQKQRDFLILAITDLHHDDPEISDYKAIWGRQMVELMDKQFCQPLEKKTGRRIPPKLVTPLLTSMMSSCFLFSPVMDRVVVPDAEPSEIKLYARNIAAIFLEGIAGKEEIH